jgi:hypothetical protein
MKECKYYHAEKLYACLLKKRREKCERFQSYISEAVVVATGEIGSMNEQIEKNFTFHPPKDAQPAKYAAIRRNAKIMATLIDNNCLDSREKDIALMKLEEAVMWANAAIARNE